MKKVHYVERGNWERWEQQLDVLYMSKDELEENMRELQFIRSISIEIIRDMVLNHDIKSFNKAFETNYKIALCKNLGHQTVVTLYSDNPVFNTLGHIELRVLKKDVLASLIGGESYNAEVVIALRRKNIQGELVRACLEQDVSKVQKFFSEFKVEKISIYNEGGTVSFYVKGSCISYSFKISDDDVINSVTNDKLVIRNSYEQSLWF